MHAILICAACVVADVSEETIPGKVTDTEGQPLAGVKVFFPDVDEDLPPLDEVKL